MVISEFVTAFNKIHYLLYSISHNYNKCRQSIYNLNILVHLHY